jgi:hypothetical protein
VADERQRRLNRDAASGDAEARVRALQEQLRRGGSGRVELAAYVGDPAARAVLSAPAPPELDLDEWVRGLQRWGKEPCVRAARAAVELVREECVRKQPRDADVPGLLRRIDAWLADPNDEGADAVHEATLALQSALHLRLFATASLHALVHAGKATWMAGIFAKHAGRCASRVARRLDEARVRGAIRQALVSWAT